MKKLMNILSICLLLAGCRSKLYLGSSRHTDDNVREYTENLCKQEVEDKILSLYSCLEARRILSGEVPLKPDGQYGDHSVLHLSGTRLMVDNNYDMETYGKDIYEDGHIWKVNNLEVSCTDDSKRIFSIKESSYWSECTVTIDKDTDSLKVFGFLIQGEDSKPYGSFHSEFSSSGTASVYYKRKSKSDIYIPGFVTFRDSCKFSSVIYYEDEVIDNCNFTR